MKYHDYICCFCNTQLTTETGIVGLIITCVDPAYAIMCAACAEKCNPDAAKRRVETKLQQEVLT